MPDPADTPVPDPAAAHVGFLRALAEKAVYEPQTLEAAVTLPVLGEHLKRALDALDGVLELADDWDTKAASLWLEVDLRDLGRPSAAEKTAAAAALRDRARDIRATVSRGLTEGGSDA